MFLWYLQCFIYIWQKHVLHVFLRYMLHDDLELNELNGPDCGYYSGTAKQAVTYDYAERLANGVMEAQVGWPP